MAWAPRVLAYPVAAVLAWEALALAVKVWRLRWPPARGEGGPPPPD